MRRINIPDKNLYEILNVNPRAETEVIGAAYNALIKKYHPDKSNGNEDYAKKLNEAKDILLDPDKRMLFDERYLNPLGKIIGDYRILELIAEGGFGKTYKAENILLEKYVCIKQANNISISDEEVLINEAKAIWDLRHSGLPAMRDVIRFDDGSLGLVMSYVPGPTLEKIVEKNKKLDPEHVAWIAERTLSALWYLHFNSVVHGDVKPQNIIVQPETHSIVLVDYGLSAVQPNHKTRSIGYTPYFAPPEQVNGKTIVPETDFYSLGMTMIYALGGDLGRRKVPSNVPDELVEFIARLIVHDVKSRPKWEDENLVETLAEVRQKAFGRRRSNMAPIPGV